MPQNKNSMEQNRNFEIIREWASKRGIYAQGDVKTQYIKLMEEVGELGRSILKNDEKEFKDAIGDCVVVLTNLAHLGKTSIEECITLAWNEIKNRQGKMENGTFVKYVEVEADYVDFVGWHGITEIQLINFLIRRCWQDYQFIKSNPGYLGFINMDPQSFDDLDYDVCIYIINERAKSNEIANKIGLNIDSASFDELIICEL